MIPCSCGHLQRRAESKAPEPTPPKPPSASTAAPQPTPPDDAPYPIADEGTSGSGEENLDADQEEEPEDEEEEDREEEIFCEGVVLRAEALQPLVLLEGGLKEATPSEMADTSQVVADAGKEPASSAATPAAATSPASASNPPEEPQQQEPPPPPPVAARAAPLRVHVGLADAVYYSEHGKISFYRSKGSFEAVCLNKMHENRERG